MYLPSLIRKTGQKGIEVTYPLQLTPAEQERYRLMADAAVAWAASPDGATSYGVCTVVTGS